MILSFQKTKKSFNIQSIFGIINLHSNYFPLKTIFKQHYAHWNTFLPKAWKTTKFIYYIYNLKQLEDRSYDCNFLENGTWKEFDLGIPELLL